MSGVLINDYSNSDSNILAVQSTLDKTFFAKIDSITLTNFDNSTQPAIAAGSIVECNGALYSFSSEESISLTDPVTSSTVADGTVYVCLVPSTSTITAAFTATAPTWSDSKQGWYGTGGQANYRYIARCLKASTAYDRKKYLTEKSGFPTVMHATGSVGNPADNSYYTFDNALSSSVVIDTNSEYTHATGVFSPDTSGFYKISMFVRVFDQSTAASNGFYFEMVEDDGSPASIASVYQTENDTASTYQSFGRVFVYELSQANSYYLRIKMTTATGLYNATSYWTIERVDF